MMRSQARFAIALALTVVVALFEFWGGAVSHSLALTTDAVHVSMDVIAIAVALAATIGASRPANRRKTFGYGRLEVIGALFNGTLLLGATAIIVYEAILRFSHPVEPHGGVMTIVAAAGLAVNLAAGVILARGHHPDLNARAAILHLGGDALGALAVIAGGLIILALHWAWIDPLLSLFVAAIIVVGVVQIVRDATDVLLEGTPPGVDPDDVERRIREIGAVTGVHDLHVWSIASDSHAMSAHVILDDRRLSEGGEVLDRVRRLALEYYGIGHVTVQLEAEHCDPGGIIVCKSDT
jgi:cobalt-zinc-cadmium efflux system protein